MPGYQTQSFPQWGESQFMSLTDITRNGTILGKTDLEAKLNTPIPCYQYFQISNVISQRKFKGNLTRPLKDFEKLVKLNPIKDKGIISTIYKILLLISNKQPPSYVQSWHKDLKVFLE